MDSAVAPAGSPQEFNNDGGDLAPWAVPQLSGCSSGTTEDFICTGGAGPMKQYHSGEIRKLKQEWKDINATIADFERLEAAASSPKPKPMGNAKSGILFQMIRKKA
jgi:hypothetical protein